MLTSNLFGLLASLATLTSQAIASPVLARQDAAAGVSLDDSVPAYEHTTIPNIPSGTVLPKRTGASQPEAASAASITAAPQLLKRANVSPEEYKSVMNSLGDAFAMAGTTPQAIISSSMDSYKANNVVTASDPAYAASFQSSVNSVESGFTSKYATEYLAMSAITAIKETSTAL